MSRIGLIELAAAVTAVMSLVRAGGAEAATISEYSPLPHPNSMPGAIANGPDGNLWFTESNSQSGSGGTDRIGRMSPDGSVTEFPLGAHAEPSGIAVGPDGNLWFTEDGANKIGRITPGGA